MRREAARDAWDSLVSWGLRDRGDGLGVVDELGARRPASMWTFVHVLSAAIDLATRGVEVPLDHLLPTLARYRRGDGYAPTPGARRRYFDDNAWLGLVSMRLADLTADGSHLERARGIFAFLRSGQDPDGAVRWCEGRAPRNACSTAPAAELALLLNERDRDPERLAFAERAAAWLDATLRNDDGLYADNLERGRVDPACWSYNQGSAAGMHRLLALATGDRIHYEHARETVAASLRTFADERLWREPPPFLAIWFRELLAFPDDGVRMVATATLRAHTERLLREALDPPTGRFTKGGLGSYDGRPTIDQAAIVQLLALASDAGG